MIVELSEIGLSFVSQCAIPVGEELTIAWRLDPSDSPLQILAVVRHNSELEVGIRSTKVGAEFLDLSLTNRLRILEFVSRRVTPTN